MAGAPGTDPTFHSKRKAINALFPYAVRLARDGQRGMIDAILRVALKSTSGGFMWHHIGPYITPLFDESSPPFLNQAITLASPYTDWTYGPHSKSAVARWATAVLATPYSEEVGQRVVDTLLQIARSEVLRPHIPINIWAWMKRRPSLPPVCRGRSQGTTPDVISHIQELGDIEVLKSYFLLVWSEWDVLYEDGFAVMMNTIKEEFYGTAMGHHREDLAERLDYVLGQLDRGLEYLKQHDSRIEESDIQRGKEQYGQLKEVLAEMDNEKALPVCLRSYYFGDRADVDDHGQNPT